MILTIEGLLGGLLYIDNSIFPPLNDHFLTPLISAPPTGIRDWGQPEANLTYRYSLLSSLLIGWFPILNL